MVMMRPRFCSIIVAPNTWQVRSTPVKFVSRMRAQSDSSICSVGTRLVTPAAATTMSTRPRSRAARVAQRRHRRDVGHVGTGDCRLPSTRANLGGRLFHQVATSSGSHDVRARVGETERDGAADPARAAHDHGDTAGEIEQRLPHHTTCPDAAVRVAHSSHRLDSLHPLHLPQEAGSPQWRQRRRVRPAP